jgi:F-type H+-transporting ATPase subunit a
MSAVEHPPIFRLPGVPDHVTYGVAVSLLLVLLAWAASRRLDLVPRGVQNLMEMVLEQFVELVDSTLGREGRPYLPLIATLGLFIVTSNLMGLVPGLMAPTSSLNTTAACALIVFFTYHAIGVRRQGLVNYLKHFAGPVPLLLKPLLFVIEIISHLARPLSLSLRLFGNMTAGHILVGIFFFMMGLDGVLGWALSGSLGGVAIGVPATILMVAFMVGFLYPLKILVAFIQAFIFCMLTMLYISGALEEAAHHAAGAHGGGHDAAPAAHH